MTVSGGSCPKKKQAASDTSNASNGPVDLNTATVDELNALPGSCRLLSAGSMT